MYYGADVEGQEWREFIPVWWEEHGKAAISAGTLLHLAQDRDMLLSILGSKSERSQAIRLGKALKAIRNRRYDDMKIEATWTSRSKQNQWRLVKVDEEQEGDVLDLFGPRDVARDVEPKRGMSRDVQNSTSRADSPNDSDELNGARGMSRDVKRDLAGAILGARYASRVDPGSHPATSRADSEQADIPSKSPRDVQEQHPAQHPANGPQHPADDADEPEIDLANLDDGEEEAEE